MRTWKPSEQRRIVRDLLILTVLAWATHTLLAQWGFAADAESSEKFVPASFSRAARIEVIASATVVAGDIRLKDIARWSDADRPALAEFGDIVLARFKEDQESQTLDVRDVKRILSDAGINLGLVSFSGSTVCSVRREQGNPVLASNAPLEVHETAPSMLSDAPLPSVVAPKRSLMLSEIICDQLASHLALPIDQLQVRFDPKDEKLSSLRDGPNQFQIAPQKSKRLGNIAWDVTISNGAGGAKKKHILTTHVQAWQTQLVAARPLAVKQVIQNDDVVEKRVLVDYLSEEPPVTRGQIVGQQSGRELPIGAVITPRVIHSVQLVRTGQLVTVIVEHGGIHVKWVAEARENGNFGQIIRVRKPGTRDEFIVIVTGPEQTKLNGGGAVDVTADARR